MPRRDTTPFCHTPRFWIPVLLVSMAFSARADVAMEIRQLTGAPTRLVWVYDEGSSHSVYAFDTEEGAGPRRLASNVQSYAKPIFTPDGSRVVYYDRKENASYIIHWDGTGLRKLVSGFASTDAGSRNFTLGQSGDRLILRLRTPRTGQSGTNPEATLCTLSSDEPNHIVVTYSAGRLVCYRNGEKIRETNEVQGDFGNWSGHHFLFGDEWNGERVWQGTLEGVALYDRALDAKEAWTNFENYRSLLLARRKDPPLAAQGRLVARSEIPVLEKIAPYRDALIVEEYEVEDVPVGKLENRRIRVVRWAILGGKALPLAPGSVGEEVRLNIEPFESNPQLQSIYLSDTLDPDADTPLYYVGF